MRYLIATLLLLPCFPVNLLSGNERSDQAGLIQEVEAAIINRTNAFRQENNLEPVAGVEKLTATASKFAKFMAETEKYGHNADGQTPAERARASGYQYCVVRENIAYRTNTAEVTVDSLIEVYVQGWIDSPPHRENMLADYVTETGVGVATTDGVTYYAVQLFGRPKEAAIELEITNQSGEAKTFMVSANDSEDTIELPPRGIVRMKRCFPTTVQMQDSDRVFTITESTQLLINEDGVDKL